MPEVLEPQNCSAEVTRAVNVPLSSSIIPRRGPWTQQGLRELDRIRAECTPHSSFDAVIDEGEFWCIVWDREREFVVLHIARIDCRYVMARANHPKLFTAPSLSAAINAALDELLRAADDRRTF